MATILIVEKHALDREAMAVLGLHGHRLLEAMHGEQALDLVRTENPDLVLTDILTPEPGGYQLVQHLHAVSHRVRPRVVFLAPAYLENEARAVALACGVSKLVPTPASSGALVAAVNAALSEPRLPEQEPGHDPGTIDANLRRVVGRLFRRLSELEQLNARLDERAARSADQLEVARSALEQEVKKRLSAEQELTQANLWLQDKAVRDALTGLYNRGYLEESLDRETSRARRNEEPFSVMMIDIDHFKRCNDSFGHATGDAVLRKLGLYLLSLARREDIPCRYGGEEFVLVMTRASPATVRERAERLRAGVQALKFECNGRDVGPITLSVGIAIFPDHGENGKAVLHAADAALYRAKQAGRNCVFVAEKPVPPET